MAEKIRDAEDEMLAALFSGDAIADDGFSDRVVGRIRRRLWLRRIILPAAAALGAAISLKPLVALIESLYGFVAALPVDVVSIPTDWLPAPHMIVLGAMLLAAMLFGLRLLEE